MRLPLLTYLGIFRNKAWKINRNHMLQGDRRPLYLTAPKYLLSELLLIPQMS